MVPGQGEAVMAASDKAQTDQGAKQEIAEGMSESGKSGGAPSSGGQKGAGTGTQPKRSGSDEVARGMDESGSGKPSSDSAKH